MKIITRTQKEKNTRLKDTGQRCSSMAAIPPPWPTDWSIVFDCQRRLTITISYHNESQRKPRKKDRASLYRDTRSCNNPYQFIL